MVFTKRWKIVIDFKNFFMVPFMVWGKTLSSVIVKQRFDIPPSPPSRFSMLLQLGIVFQIILLSGLQVEIWTAFGVLGAYKHCKNIHTFIHIQKFAWELTQLSSSTPFSKPGFPFSLNSSFAEGTWKKYWEQSSCGFIGLYWCLWMKFIDWRVMADELLWSTSHAIEPYTEFKGPTRIIQAEFYTAALCGKQCKMFDL